MPSTDEARAAQGYVREVGRALTGFARTVRTLKLYGPRHPIVLRALGELEATFGALLAGDRALTLRLRTDAFVLDDVEVLEETDTTDSIPYVFYRDGIRRLELSAGVTREELGVLVGAAAQGFLRTSFGDDVASYLWRHELEHVRWVVVDTTLSAAPGDAAPGPVAPAPGDPDDAIDGLLFAIYGDPSDVGHRVTQVDVADFRGKAIADQLDDVDEMAPGFHPARGVEGAAYAERLRAEVEQDESKIPTRAALMALGAFAAAREPGDVEAVSEALLQLYDAELGSGSLRLALPLVAGVRDLSTLAGLEARCAAWLEHVGSEPRLRQVTKLMSAAPGEQLAPIFLAAGRAGVPTLLGLIAGLEQAEHRRLLSDVVLSLGVDDLRPLVALLDQPGPSAARRAGGARPRHGRAPSPVAARAPRAARVGRRLPARGRAADRARRARRSRARGHRRRGAGARGLGRRRRGRAGARGLPRRPRVRGDARGGQAVGARGLRARGAGARGAGARAAAPRRRRGARQARGRGQRDRRRARAGFCADAGRDLRARGLGAVPEPPRPRGHARGAAARRGGALMVKRDDEEPWDIGVSPPARGARGSTLPAPAGAAARTSAPPPSRAQDPRAHDLARGFLTAVFMGVRTAQIHDVHNRAFERAIELIRESAEQLHRATQGFALAFVDGSIYLNEQRIRIEASAHTSMRTLGGLLEQRGLGGIRMSGWPEVGVIRALVLLLAGSAEAASTSDGLEAVRGLFLPPQRLADGSAGHVDRRVFARQCYAKLVLVLRDLRAPDAARRGPRVRAVRLVQDLVELGSERLDFLARLGSNHHGASIDELHGANVTALSLAMGLALGLSRAELVDLGIGALFHDLGRGEATRLEADHTTSRTAGAPRWDDPTSPDLDAPDDAQSTAVTTRSALGLTTDDLVLAVPSDGAEPATGPSTPAPSTPAPTDAAAGGPAMHPEELLDAVEQGHAYVSFARVLIEAGTSRVGLLRAVVAGEHHVRPGEVDLWGVARPRPSVLSRIVAVADAYDGLTSGLAAPDGRPRAPLDALAALSAGEDPRLDLDLVDLLVNVLRAFPVGCVVRLDDGARAVVRSHAGGTRWDRPVVAVGEGPGARAVDLMRQVDGRFPLRIVSTVRFAEG